ncbi:DUF5063 domain-containing protein [Novilysobacter spongiicola]|uniref:DUF5063 domain-containing protein n=1 Tax=Novilysobacter spongiicola TaxID=435289 RepID=UPI00099B20B0|nr:DUF5063 domain-containing protein [Lysobacter spongiicola]
MKQIDAFRDTATAFCKWAESAPVAPADDVDTAIKMLSKLLALVHELPELFDEEDTPGATHEEWLTVYKRFGSLPFNYYASYSEPHDTADPSPGTGDMADDLADTWRDLKGGLALYQKGNYAAAVWEWRESFSVHWGRHASGALHALQCWRS